MYFHSFVIIHINFRPLDVKQEEIPMKITFVTTTDEVFNTFEAIFPSCRDFRMANEAMKPNVEIAYDTTTGQILYLKSQDRGV